MQKKEYDVYQSLDTLLYSPKTTPQRLPINKEKLRLYQFNICPYSARVRYAFAAKKVPYQCVELDCDVKAQWHAEFNGGEIPVLETPEGELF